MPQLGVNNTAFFHRVVKIRNARNSILFLKDDQGNRITDPQQVKQLVVGYYYRNLLDTSKWHLAQEIWVEFQQVH